MATTFSLRRKLARLVVGIYLASAVWVLIAFLRAPPDGLANIWTVVWTAPISFAGVYLERWTGVGFPFMPTRYFGYYAGHTIYFVLAVTLIALVAYRVIAGKRS